MSARAVRPLAIGLALCFIEVIAGPSVRAQLAPPVTPLVVYCYDRSRDVVSRELIGQCHGTIVDESEASAIKARRDQEIARTLAKPAQKGPQGQRLVSVGTAFYVDETGRLLTNGHVIADCDTVRISGENSQDAKVIAVDAQHDLAIVQGSKSAPGFAWFRTGSGGGASGTVIAVGFPNEGLPTLLPVVTQGKLLRADDGLGRVIIGADFRHGSSGSPIFDSSGLVIGIVDAKLDISHIFARTGKEVPETGIGIAVSPILDFLRRTDTRFHVRDRDADADTRQILALARSFVARAECWR